MRNNLILIVGKSGSGKTTIVRALYDLFGFEEAVSVTTRSPREGEVQGVAYYFATKKEFDDAINFDMFVEQVEFNGNKYGVTKQELRDRTDRVTTLLVVEPNGASQILEKYDGPIKIVELEVSEEVRRQRMIDRGDELSKVEERISHDSEYWSTVRDLVTYNLVWTNEDDGPLVSNLTSLVTKLGLFPEPQGV